MVLAGRLQHLIAGLCDASFFTLDSKHFADESPGNACALAGVLLWLQAWDALLLVAAVLTGQALVHLLVGMVWENAHAHWAHWLGRFQWLHYALLLFPLSFWLIAREAEAQWTMDLSLQVAIAVSSLLYLSGLSKSAWGFSSSQPSTQTLKILYLCALELGPLLWVIKSYL